METWVLKIGTYLIKNKTSKEVTSISNVKVVIIHFVL